MLTYQQLTGWENEEVASKRQKEDTVISEIEALRYNEMIELPKFKAGLDRLVNKRIYNSVLSTHGVNPEDLLPFVEIAISEGNAVLIQREWNGYTIIVWKD